ncbi:unnamed protein product, partial [marine sediment metagenome]
KIIGRWWVGTGMAGMPPPKEDRIRWVWGINES